MKSLYEQFINLRNEKNSIIILGLDPKTKEQREKVLELAQIKEGLVGFKPNDQFYQTVSGKCLLNNLNIDPKLINIIDAKLADGTNTNIAALDSYRGIFNSVTLNTPDVEGTIKAASDRDLTSIIMGAMSFASTLKILESDEGLQYLKVMANRGIEAGASAIVMGATSYVPEKEIGNVVKKYIQKKDSQDIEHLCLINMSNENIENAIYRRNELFQFLVDKMQEYVHLLALVPGFGRQGGNLEYFLESGIDLNRCMINAGSDILKAEGPQAALAEMNNTFNYYRRI